jgi:2-methylcitrate dehydratase PrpD
MACSRAAGSRMNFGTDTKPLHAGFAARAGVECAELAALDLDARADGLESDLGLADLYGGARPLQLGELGRPFALDTPGVELKPYPSCRFTHRTIDAVLALRERHPDAEPIALECEIDPFALQILIHPRPQTGLQAKFSLPYCAAVAWLDGWPDLESFRDARAARDDVQSWLQRVTVQPASSGDDAVTAVFASGERDREAVPLARGHPSRPLERGARLHKVRGCLEPALGIARAAELITAVESLESLPSAAKLGALCTPSEDAARDQLERARGTWVLVIHESSESAAGRFPALRRVLRLKSFEADALRSRLPGPVRRGARVDLLPILERLKRLGVRATLERRADSA